ncbi:MAG: hypothetical protein ACLUSP_06345 [Christensenellales bacterium]
MCEYLITNLCSEIMPRTTRFPSSSRPPFKVVDAATLQAAKDSIDLAVNGIAEDKQLKKKCRRQKRRERKEQEAAEANADPTTS